MTKKMNHMEHEKSDAEASKKSADPVGANEQKTGSEPTFLDQVESALDGYLVKKAPFRIPADVADLVVKLAPYAVMVWAVVLGRGILFALSGPTWVGSFHVRRLFLGGYFTVAESLLSIILIISVLIALSAVSGLFGQTRRGWRLVFVATLVALSGGVFFSPNPLGWIFGTALFWYVSFQVRDRYRK